ncbi:hypothetical protein ACQJBY_000316 [Aegilops geniculata]
MEDERNEVVHTLRYQLVLPRFYESSMLAESFLKMPSDRSFDNQHRVFPRVVMDLKSPDDLHCLTLMKTCAHRNILHVKVVREEYPYLVAWTEPYEGRLIDYLRSLKSNLGEDTGHLSRVLPSVQLRTIVRQICDGIRQLILYEKYHGNFSLHNTYYQMESGMPVVKLTGFKKKEGTKLAQCQLEDTHDVAFALDEICAIAEEFNRKGHRIYLDCCQLIDLSKKLKEVSLGDIHSVMENIHKHSFFWECYERTRFYVSDLPFALRMPDFRKEVEASSICIIPWNVEYFSGLLNSMNKYRLLDKKEEYDGTKKTGFCSFYSGLYSHEYELPEVKSGRLEVDQCLQQRNPKTCFEIVCLMPDREKKYMLSKREAVKGIQKPASDGVVEERC